MRIEVRELRLVRRATERLQAPHPERDLFAYNVVSVAEADIDRIRDILRGAFREIRTLVSASHPAEAVLLRNLQLLTLFPRPLVP